MGIQSNTQTFIQACTLHLIRQSFRTLFWSNPNIGQILVMQVLYKNVRPQ
uniref:Uncharacterized protein n=1 Tax=Anguilla anguilla TaxID=7936 RepID=A0A0E9PPV4_ANGAN